MIRRIVLLLSTLTVLLAATPAVTASAASAFDPFQQACSAGGNTKNNPACSANGSDPITGRNGILYRTSKILALIAGLGAVIMIMIGGFMYITAGGDSSKANTAKSTITGAVVGLMVILLSETIIAFTINLVQK
jgi:type IV secretion system pilin